MFFKLPHRSLRHLVSKARVHSVSIGWYTGTRSTHRISCCAMSKGKLVTMLGKSPAVLFFLLCSFSCSPMEVVPLWNQTDTRGSEEYHLSWYEAVDSNQWTCIMYNNSQTHSKEGWESKGSDNPQDSRTHRLSPFTCECARWIFMPWVVGPVEAHAV